MYPSGEPLKPRPLGFRECQVPRPGHCFVISDWSMMELVCLAQTCLEWFGWSRLADALNAGRDPHEELGGTIAGHSLVGHPRRKLYRTLAKAPNFGFPGGLGAERFSVWATSQYGAALREAGFERVIAEAFALELKRHWRAQWPEMVHYARRIGELASGGSATIELARSGYVRGAMNFKEASNFPFQGRASRAAKDALWRCYVAHRAGALGAPVLFVHDEIVTECPIEHALEHAALQERIMIEALHGVCPDVRGGVETMITAAYTK